MAVTSYRLDSLPGGRSSSAPDVRTRRMPALVDPARYGPPRPLPVLAPGLGAVALVGVSMQVFPPVATFTAAVGAVSAVYGAMLVGLALRIHESRRSYGPCRGAGFLG